MGKERAHIVVYGRVQGVFFRASAEEKARELGLTGWVRNRSDGTVEIVAEGDREALEKLISWCHIGPKHARVTRVEVVWEPATGEFLDFTIRYD